MRQIILCFCLLLAISCSVDAQEVLLISDGDITPAATGVLTSSGVFGPELEARAEREKRKILEPVVEASFGIKSVLLNIIFGKVNQLIDYKTRLVDELDRKNIALNKAYGLYGQKPCDTPVHTTVKPVGSTTTEDIADIDSTRVSLDIPGEFFGSSFSLVTRISRIISDVILNTAARTQRLVEAVKPTFGRVLGIKTSPRKSSTTVTSSASSSARSSRSDIQRKVLMDSESSVSQNLVDLGS